jgi:serine/threonine protein phosphatase PrpC
MASNRIKRGEFAPISCGDGYTGGIPTPYKVSLERSALVEECHLPLRVKAAAKSDVGLMRKNNQDSFGSDEALGVYVVCDGMGGAAAGEVASDIATETFLAIARQELEADRTGSPEVTRRALKRAAVAANRAVSNRAAYDERYRGMGSTLVGVRIVGASLIAINVGDSRVYLTREGIASQLTVDHSYVAEQVRLGAMTEMEAENSSMQSLITRAIGAEEDVYPDLFEAILQPGDTILLTTDGLTRHLTDANIGALLDPGATATPEEACERLIAMANKNGGSDNITCFVLRVG